MVDGCIRDSVEIGRMQDFPVYAKGVTPNGAIKMGRINFRYPAEIKVICRRYSGRDRDGLLVIKPRLPAGWRKEQAG